MDLMSKGIGAIIALIVIMYTAPSFVTAVNALNLTSVAGTDLTWTLLITSILLFVGIALGAKKYIMGK